MFNHIMIGTDDIDAAKNFYLKVLAVLGVENAAENTSASGHKRVFFLHDGDVLALTQPIDDGKVTVSNGMTIGFKCNSPEQVKELHDVAVAAGATSVEDPPGLRETTMGNAHLCYFRDLDGHKICGIYRQR